MKVETFDCPLGGVTLHAVAMGKGPLAILLHGITANAYVFLPLMERMKAIRDEEGYREAHMAYIKAVTRLAVGSRPRG